jgi:SagB-type dehydrogenase family enzyme
VRPADELPSLDDAFEDSTFMTGAAAVVLISNVFERYQQRYSNRGYRYALIDTGHIGENLRIAAAAAGIDHEAQPRFIDTQLDALVGADGEDEAVCAVHVLGRSGPAAAPNGTPPAQARFVEKAVTGAHVTDDSDPTVRYHASTALVRGQAKKTRGESPDDTTTNAAAPAQPATSQPPIALANADPPPSTSAEACIASRRSPKSFAERPISAAQLGFVARAAYPPEAWRRSLGVDLQLVVHRVDGVSPGLYRYVPEQAALEVVKLDDYTESLPRVCLGQSKAGDAAVGFAMVAHIQRAAAEHGERAYRDLLVEAGEMGERVYLAAEALGLCARNLASFIDEDLNSLIGLDGADAAVVHLTMLGHGT